MRLDVVIPTTVGQIYGKSPLDDADDFETSASVIHNATISVSAPLGKILKTSNDTFDGSQNTVEWTQKLNAPIQLRIQSWLPALLPVGDGSKVLSLTKVPSKRSRILTASILLDCSGSMFYMAGSNMALAKSVIAELEFGKGTEDRTNLWYFDNHCERAEATNSPHNFGKGTAIGLALRTVIAGDENNDIVLITEGKSHDLNVQEIASSGRRVHVVLIGNDALEAHVGHLAMLTGGNLFFLSEPQPNHNGFPAPLEQSEVSWSTERLIAKTLLHRLKQDALPEEGTDAIGGVQVSQIAMRNHEPFAELSATQAADAGAWYAARFELGRLSEADATARAIELNLLTHLTSLVMVDEAGEIVASIAAQRKVPLMAVNLSSVPQKYSRGKLPIASAAAPATRPPGRRVILEGGRLGAPVVEASMGTGSTNPQSSTTRFSPESVCSSLLLSFEIQRPGDVLEGRLENLSDADRHIIEAAAMTVEVNTLAKLLGLNPYALIVCLVAANRPGRLAKRIAQLISSHVGTLSPEMIQDIADVTALLNIAK